MRSYRVWNLLSVGLVCCLVSSAGWGRQPNSDPEVVSPLGRLLFARAEDDSTADAFLAIIEAQSKLDRANSSEEFRLAALRMGRALDAVWRYREAVSVYSRGLSRVGDDGELFLRRGASLLRIRSFDRALSDLRAAVRQLEGNYEALYRLGLAQFVTRDFRRAARTLDQATFVAANDDELVAALHWAYLSSRRAGRRKDAEEFLGRVPDRMDLEYSSDYFLLIQMYFGRVGEYVVFNQEASESERSSTRGFGVGNWHLDLGGEGRARDIFSVVTKGADWPAIGVIAAEVDLQRLER